MKRIKLDQELRSEEELFYFIGKKVGQVDGNDLIAHLQWIAGEMSKSPEELWMELEDMPKEKIELILSDFGVIQLTTTIKRKGN